MVFNIKRIVNKINLNYIDTMTGTVRKMSL